ncbi:MAG: hypothetical protein KDD82_12280 [Planctomycetes bacterium]|nr:hypothetical protein [Planctomycetota bacterium]
MKRWTAAIALAAALGSASAQDSIPPTEPVELPETGARVAPLPNWSIRKEVDNLDSSMREYNALTNSLSKASAELGEEFKKYLANPNDEVLASSVEKKMALYAKQVMADFDDIISDQDLLGANFRDLQRKLVTFSEHLELQADGFDMRLGGYKNKAKSIEKKLIELSVQIKENPPEDPDELRKLKREFARQFRSYRLQTRYVNGYQRRFQNYRTLGKNLQGLAGLFVNLHEKFNELIENLTNERQYLRDSLRLQADTLRIKQIIRDGILGSEHAIGNVAEKLADLYTKVDAFTKVHERINTDMTKFVESQEILMDVTRKIDKIGMDGAPIGDIAEDMDKAIQAFYDKGLDGNDEELIGVEEAPTAEDAAEEDR